MTSEFVDRASGRARISRGRNNYIYRARAVMEAHLGRSLGRDETVHHKNGDTTDDRIENLEVLSRSEHGRLHGVFSPLAGRWALEHDACVECGATDRPHAGHRLCRRCYGRQAQRAYRARKAVAA